MARYGNSGTLGMQLYSQYQRDKTNRYFQEKALEEERQRREAERRRQEEQRKKASDHGAFGQTLQTVGMIGGAIAGGLSTGTPQGAIAGSSLGSAGASTIMNLFPNVGGTEPSGSNPYYDKPSDMARLGSTINTGLQAYGMYSQAAAAQAKEDLMNEIKADMQRNVNSGISPGPGAPASEQFFDYKNATAAQISDRIKSLPSWQNATGLFGEQLVNDSAALSIANNTYDQISQSAMAGLQFINGLENNEAKQQALQNWQNTYGQSRADLIPEYGLESMQQSVQSGMADTATKKDRDTKTFDQNYEQGELNLEKTQMQIEALKSEIAEKPKKEAEAKYLQLAELGLKAIQAGAPYDPATFAASGNVSPELASQVSALASTYAASYTKAETAKTQQQTREAAEQKFKLTMDVMKNVPWEADGLRQQLALEATSDPQLQQLLSLLGPKKEGDDTNPASPYSRQTMAAAQAKYLFYSKGGGEFDEVDPMTDQEIKAKVLREDPNSDVTRYIVENIIGDKTKRQAVPATQDNLIDQEASRDDSEADSLSPDVASALNNTGVPYIEKTQSPTVQAAEAQGVNVQNTSPVEPVPSNSPGPSNNKEIFDTRRNYLNQVKTLLSKNMNPSIQNLVADIDLLINHMNRAENLPKTPQDPKQANEINFILRGITSDFERLVTKIKSLEGSQ